MSTTTTVTTVSGGPSPALRVTVTGIDTVTGADYITVQRVTSSAGRVNVRGAVRIPATGDSFYIDDYEAPLNVPVTYDPVLYDDEGLTLANQPQSSPQTLETPVNEAWLADPLRPTVSMLVNIEEWPKRNYAQPSSVLNVTGRARPVVLLDTRQAMVSAVVLLTRTANERDALRDLLLTTNPVLMRFGNPDWDQPDGHFAVGDLDESRVVNVADRPHRRFVMDLVEVDSPSPDTVAPTFTWADVLTFPTWAHVTDNRDTWLELQQDATNA